MAYNLAAMDESVAATEWHSRLATYLDAARSGSSFVITRGSRIAGRLIPPDVEELTREDDQS